MIYNQNQLISDVFVHVFILLLKAIKVFRVLLWPTNTVYAPVIKDLILKHIHLQNILYAQAILFSKQNLQLGIQQYFHLNKMMADKGIL